MTGMVKALVRNEWNLRDNAGGNTVWFAPAGAVLRAATVLGAALASLCAPGLHAGSIAVPNASFEGPPTAYAGPEIDAWQKAPQPVWYTRNDWDFLVGVFANQTPTDPTYIDNCDGLQAAFFFAVPQVAIFQDYDSTYGTNTVPTHAFDAKFEPGKSYTLTLAAMGGGGNMPEGTVLEMSLYYRDSNSNHVPVATANITHTLSVFSNLTHFLDFKLHTPVVRSTDACAGQHIGIQFLSTFAPGGGYWDIDNVRLVSTVAPVLQGYARVNGTVSFTLQSEPGAKLEVLASPDLALPTTQWTSLGVLTNVSGSVPFVDPASASLAQRFYTARQVP